MCAPIFNFLPVEFYVFLGWIFSFKNWFTLLSLKPSTQKAATVKWELQLNEKQNRHSVFALCTPQHKSGELSAEKLDLYTFSTRSDNFVKLAIWMPQYKSGCVNQKASCLSEKCSYKGDTWPSFSCNSMLWLWVNEKILVQRFLIETNHKSQISSLVWK